MKNGEKFDITFNRKTFPTIKPLKAIQSILFESTKYDESIFAMHGAAVEHNGEAYLFLAPTNSGKTTLTTYLTMRGFSYITDDCILMDRSNFTVYPHANPIHLRSDGFGILKDKGFNTKLYTSKTIRHRRLCTVVP